MFEDIRRNSDSRLRAVAAKGRPLLLLFGGTFGSAIFALSAQLFLARLVSIADYGRLATVLAAVNLLSPVAAFGVNWFWIQAFGREGYGGFRWIRPSYQLLSITNAVSVALLIAYFLFAGNFSREVRFQEILFAVTMLLGQSAVELSSARFQLEENFGLLALWQSLSQLGRLAIAVALVFFQTRSLYEILAGYGFIGFCLVGCGLHILRRMHSSKLKLSGHLQNATLANAEPAPSALLVAKLSFPFAFITVFYLIYFQGVVLLLASILGPEAAALFSAAMLILSALMLIPNIVFTKFLVSRICRWAEHDRVKFDAVFHLSVASMIIAGLLVMILVAGLAPFAVTTLFGEKYYAAVKILVWLSPTIPLRFVQSAYSAMMVSEANVRRRVKYASVSAVLSVVINIALLPTVGIVGGAIAANLSEAVLLVITVWGAGRYVTGVRLAATFKPSKLRAAASSLFLSET